MSRASKILSKSPQDRPRRPKIASGRFTTAPGRPDAPGTPPRAPGRPKNRPGTPPKRLHGRPGSPKIGPQCPQDASKGARAPKKSPRDAPKTPPRASGEPQHRPRTPPRRLQGRPGSLKSPPHRFRMHQDGPSISPACSKGRFGVDLGPILCRCWLRLDAFSAYFFACYSFYFPECPCI